MELSYKSVPERPLENTKMLGDKEYIPKIKNIKQKRNLKRNLKNILNIIK